MDCILFRHAIAIPREEWEGDDAERPLVTKGIRKGRIAAAGLLRLGVKPTHLFSSPAARALETAKILRELLREMVAVKICDELLPDAPPDKLFPELATLPEEACVLCVGHEPNLGETAGVMLFGKPTTGLVLKKAGACCIAFDGTPQAGRGTLRWWLTPSQLRALAKKS